MSTIGATYTIQSDPGGTGSGLFASTALGSYTAAQLIGVNVGTTQLCVSGTSIQGPLGTG
jgi:hypothetical protein